MAMLLEWSFDEASGAVVDSTGNGRGFSLTGNSTRTAAGSGDTLGGSAPNSKGLTITGTDIQAGPSITGLNTNARTVILSVKTSSSDPCWFLEGHRSAEDTGVWGWLNLSGTFRFRAKNSSNTAFDRTLTLDAANFHKLAFTHDGVNTLKVYRDDSGGVATQVGADINMGGLIWAADDIRVFDGSLNAVLDHVRIFDTALTATEISTWMNTPTPTPSGATNLVIQDMAVPVAMDQPTLTRIMDLAIQKMLVATRQDAPSFTQVHNITISDMFLQTAADIVNFAGSGGKPVASVSDLQAQKLPVLTGKTGSVPDLLWYYYGGLSGLIPATSYTVSDHQRVYWETQTGLTKQSLADLEKAFYDAQLVPSGSLADRAYVYWSGL